MKYLKLFFAILLFSGFFKYSHAQNVELTSGDASILKGQPTIQVTFNYDKMKIGEFTEELYIKQKKSEFRKPADADKFIAKWKADFKDSHQPKFIEQFNFNTKKLKLQAVTDDETAKYTMIVNTDLIDPGFSGKGIARETFINLTVNIVESANPEDILASILVEKVVGVGETTVEMKDQQARITNAYGNAGLRLAKLLVRLCK